MISGVSSNGNIFRVTGPLCGEFTSRRWIPLTKANDAELWCWLWSAPWINGWVNNREAGDLRRHRPHYEVIAMEGVGYPGIWCLVFRVDNVCVEINCIWQTAFPGLVLELYIGQNEYLPILSDVAGIKLLIHNESYMPLPEKEGVVLSPGFASDIAIVRVSTHVPPNDY